MVFLSALIKLRFTLLFITFVCIFSLQNNVHVNSLSQKKLKRFGFSLSDLNSGNWGNLFSSTLITESPRGFYQGLIISIIGVGGLEWHVGFWITALLFFGSHLLTLFIMSGLLGLPYFKVIGKPKRLLNVRDVGPSIGYFSCLAALIGYFGGVWNYLNLVILVILVIVLFARALPPQQAPVVVIADLAHVIGFGLGMIAMFFLRPIV